MAKRTSGQVSVRLSFDGSHDCYVCCVSTPDERPRRIMVGYPGRIVCSVDSPESYDNAARAAISFAGMLGYADIDHTGTAILTRKR